MDQEKRLTKRVWVGQERGEVQIRVRLLGEKQYSQSVDLTDISIGGAHLEIYQPNLIIDWLTKLEIKINEGPWFTTQIIPVHTLKLGRVWHVGVQFYNLPTPLLLQLCKLFIAVQEDLSPRTFLTQHSVLGELDSGKVIQDFFQQKQKPFQVFHDIAQPSSGTFHLEGFNVEENVLHGQYESTELDEVKEGQEYTFAAPISNMLHYFTSTVKEVQPGSVSLVVPDKIIKGGIRKTERAPVPCDEELLIEFIHPYQRNHAIHKQIRELGMQGLSFDTNIDEDLLAPGMLIGSAVICLPRRPVIYCSLVIRGVYPTPQGLRCGVELLDFHGCKRQQWIDGALEYLSPTVHEAKSWSLDEVWELYDRSGYLNEKSAELMLPQREKFQERWKNLTNSRSSSKLFVFKEEDLAIATICISRIYSKTYLAHHLAATLDEYSTPTKKLEVLYSLIPQSMIQWTTGIDNESVILGTFDADKSINKWVWENFCEQYSVDAKSGLVYQRFFSFELNDVIFQKPQSTLKVGLATPKELHRISDDLLERDGVLAHRTFDYTRETIQLPFWQTDPDNLTIEHQRKIFVVRQQEQILGYSIVESSNPGVNIFSLYNTFRVILIHQDSNLEEEIKGLLFARALQTFRERGVGSAIQVVGEHDTEPVTDQYTQENSSFRFIVTHQHMPLLISYLADRWEL